MKINKKLLLFLILLFNIIIRIPALFDPVSYGDECIYLTLGQAFNKGLVYYRDIHDNKPPLLYLMAALAGGQQIWFRTFTIVWTTINAYLIYRLAKKIFKKDYLQLIATFIFVILSILPEGYIPNGENYMIMPTTLGVLLLLNGKALLAGLAISMGFLFKIPIAFDFVGIFLAYFLFKPKSLKEFFKQFQNKKIYLFVLGFVAPIIISIIYYASKGAFEPYLRSALMQNIGYLSSWTGGEESSFIVRNKGLFIRAGIVLLVSIYLFIRKKRLGFYFTFFSMWYIFALYGVLLSERPYPHYLIELVPSASILIVALLKKLNWEKIVVVIVFWALFKISFEYYNFWWYPVIPYYQNFLKFGSGQIQKEEFFSYFGTKTLNDYEVSKYVKKHSQPNERIFIWGDGACIYALSERLPPGRYTVNYHIFDFNGYDETIKAINNREPNIIIKLKSEKRSFPELDNLLLNEYTYAKNINEAEIYHKIFSK